MGDGSQKLERVLLLLKHVRVGIGESVYFDKRGLQLGRLPFRRRGLEQSFDRHACARAELFDFAFVVGELAVGHDLQIAEAAAVVDLQKAETALAVAPRTNPAAQPHFAPRARRISGL